MKRALAIAVVAAIAAAVPLAASRAQENRGADVSGVEPGGNVEADDLKLGRCALLMRDVLDEIVSRGQDGPTGAPPIFSGLREASSANNYPVSFLPGEASGGRGELEWREEAGCAWVEGAFTEMQETPFVVYRPTGEAYQSKLQIKILDVGPPGDDGRRFIRIRLDSASSRNLRVAGAASSEEESARNVIWLDSDPVETRKAAVLLCAGDCKEEAEAGLKQARSDALFEERVSPAPAEIEFMSQGLRPGVEGGVDAQAIGAPGPASLSTPVTVSVVDEAGSPIADLQAEIDKSQDDCLKPAKPPADLQALADAYLNCLSLKGGGYQITKREAGFSGNQLTLVLTAVSSKPEFIGAIVVEPNISSLNCSLNGAFKEKSGKVHPIRFANLMEDGKRVLRSQKPGENLPWRGGVLEISELEDSRVDCRPGLQKTFDIEDANVDSEGTVRLKIDNIESKLGNAVVFVNTFFGTPASATDAGTMANYPGGMDRADLKDVLHSFLEGTVTGLRERVARVTLVYRDAATKDFRSITLADKLDPAAARAIPQMDIGEGNFVQAVAGEEIASVARQERAKYVISIGQSGLNGSYCGNKEWLLPARQQDGPQVFLRISFANDDNPDNPRPADMLDGTSKLPARRCEEDRRHIVVFPESRRAAGWEDSVAAVLNAVFSELPGGR